MNVICLDRKKARMLKPISSVGPDLDHLEAERNIPSDPLDNRKRRTILLKKENDSWGFTIQTYGFKNKKTGEIEVYTYVDYVALNGPAQIAGMRRGDIILSVNGKSVEFATHQELVSVIQSSGNQARMVVLFVDCCKKVELHDRLIKLKRLLSMKINELREVEKKERELMDEFCFTRGLDRFDNYRQSVLSIQSRDSSLDRYSIITSNGNLYDIPNTATLHLDTSNSNTCSDDMSDSTDDTECYPDVNYADDSDGDSGISYEDFPRSERRNTIIDCNKFSDFVRERRGTLVGPMCECVGDSICQFCELRQRSESLDAPSSECSEDSTPVLDQSEEDPEKFDQSEDTTTVLDQLEEFTPEYDQSAALDQSKNTASELNQSEDSTLVLDQSEETVKCEDSNNSLTDNAISESNPDQIPKFTKKDSLTSNESADSVDEDDSSLTQSYIDSSLPAGQVESNEESPETEEATATDDDWDFPFWTEGSVCINLDDEQTKL
ncbi:dentin sialophosphoprotein-like isoform X2 [Saccostrea cucullata]|uniref:dentin sialophosphoprotein-like isoform X2 n=1 Tax=Saccostrea cuccullata TaxID=36930 RepID=UPI002ED15A7B